MDQNQTEEKRGYKHPPKEHRFKPGQKPRPRKKQAAGERVDTVHLFWRVLQEPRKAAVDGKQGWFRASDLVVRRAFALAEQGNSTLNRLLNQLLLQAGEAQPHGHTMILEPDHPEADVVTLELPDTHEYVGGEVRRKR